LHGWFNKHLVQRKKFIPSNVVVVVAMTAATVVLHVVVVVVVVVVEGPNQMHRRGVLVRIKFIYMVDMFPVTHTTLGSISKSFCSHFSLLLFFLTIKDGEVQIGPLKDFGRKQKPGAKKAVGGARVVGEEERNKRKTSLRLGTSRKGRAAEVLSRRGSLKKRDRRSQREARAEAAIERKTVVVPEYVGGSGVPSP
jgi:hypothetical protein